MAKSSAPEDFFRCPHCGTKVRCGAVSCPECGSDDETGWSWDADPWSGDPPAEEDLDDDEEYESFLAREFPEMVTSPPRTAPGLAWYWKLAALLLLVSFLLSFFL